MPDTRCRRCGRLAPDLGRDDRGLVSLATLPGRRSRMTRYPDGMRDSFDDLCTSTRSVHSATTDPGDNNLLVDGIDPPARARAGYGETSPASSQSATSGGGRRSWGDYGWAVLWGVAITGVLVALWLLVLPWL